MRNRNRIIKPSLVIKWLQRFPKTARFKYENNGKKDVCLFSKFLRYYFGLPKAICCTGGDMWTYETKWTGNVKQIVPFHDDFWRGSKWSLTRDQAISKLRNLPTNNN
jgi:hypothetical protein